MVRVEIRLSHKKDIVRWVAEVPRKGDALEVKGAFCIVDLVTLSTGKKKMGKKAIVAVIDLL